MSPLFGNESSRSESAELADEDVDGQSLGTGLAIGAGIGVALGVGLGQTENEE